MSHYSMLPAKKPQHCPFSLPTDTPPPQAVIAATAGAPALLRQQRQHQTPITTVTSARPGPLSSVGNPYQRRPCPTPCPHPRPPPPAPTPEKLMESKYVKTKQTHKAAPHTTPPPPPTHMHTPTHPTTMLEARGAKRNQEVTQEGVMPTAVCHASASREELGKPRRPPRTKIM